MASAFFDVFKVNDDHARRESDAKRCSLSHEAGKLPAQILCRGFTCRGDECPLPLGSPDSMVSATHKQSSVIRRRSIEG